MEKQKQVLINLTNPREITTDLITCPEEEQRQFVDNLSDEIRAFAEVFANSYKDFVVLSQLIEKTKITKKISQKDYVFFFAYQFFDNLYSSVKIMALGFHVASGNLLRQTAEGLSLAWLLSLNHQIDHFWKNIDPFNFYECFRDKKHFAQSYLSITLLEKNKELLDLTGIGLEFIQALKKHTNFFSHPTGISTLSLINVNDSSQMFIGGGFDSGKIKQYREEMEARILLCKSFPELIKILIVNVKKLHRNESS